MRPGCSRTGSRYSHTSRRRWSSVTVATGSARSIDIDIAAVGRWADKQSISYTGHADLASRDEVYELIAECIAKVNAELALEPRWQNRRSTASRSCTRNSTADDGLLTRTGKLRRGAIAERYAPLVDAMYEGRAEVRVGSAHADGQQECERRHQDPRREGLRL